MKEYRNDVRISESCVDPNPFMVERQDQDNFTRFQTRERCALEIAVYAFKERSYNCTYILTKLYQRNEPCQNKVAVSVFIKIELTKGLF